MRATQTRQDVTIKRMDCAPPFSSPKARWVRKCSLIFKLAPTSKFRCSRERVYVAGTASLAQAEANALMSLDSGFGEGSYSTTYLNKTVARSFRHHRKVRYFGQCQNGD